MSKAVGAMVLAFLLLVAACSGDDEGESSDASTTTSTTTADAAWAAAEIQDMIDLCVQDAANRSFARPRIPHYGPGDDVEMCGEDVQLLQAQGCSVTKAALVLTDWDQDRSPLQCPAGP